MRIDKDLVAASATPHNISAINAFLSYSERPMSSSCSGSGRSIEDDYLLLRVVESIATHEAQ